MAHSFDEVNSRSSRMSLEDANMSTNRIVRSVSGTALLLLTSPHEIPDIVRRPLTYNFTDRFQQEVLESISTDPDSNNAETDMANYLLNSQAARRSVTPTDTGSRVCLHPYGEYWNFLLVLDEPSVGGSFGARSSFGVRRMYSGWIANDEPFFRNGIDNPLNPNALLDTTNYHEYISAGVAGPRGYEQSFNAHGDWQFIDSMMLQQSSDGNTLYDLQPHRVAEIITPSSNLTSDDDGMTLYSLPKAAVQQADGGTLTMDTSVGDANEHLATIVRGIRSAASNARLDGHDIISDRPRFYQDATQAFASKSTYYAPSERGRDHPLSPDKCFSIGDILYRYPDLKVEVIYRDPGFAYDVRDTMDRNKSSNIYTSLVTSTMPYVLSQYGIANLAFRYDSFRMDGVRRYHSNNGEVSLMCIEMMFHCDEATIRARWQMVLRELQRGLFASIAANAGEFSLFCNCSVFHSTLVDLHIYGEDLERGMVEVNNNLAALASSGFGNRAILDDNSRQLGSLMETVYNETSPGCDYPQDDDAPDEYYEDDPVYNDGSF